MRVTIVGGHGRIAMLTHPLLVARGHRVRALIRKAEQAEEVRAAGAVPVVCDVEAEADISEAVGPAEAVIFAAGAGPGSGAARKWTVDRDGALKLIEAARRNGIRRYLMISSMGAGEPRGGGVFRVYLEAKGEADRALRESGLDHTILRPGRLTDDAPTGLVRLEPRVPRGEVSRADVAAVLAELLEAPGTIGKTLELVGGDVPIAEAVAAAGPEARRL